MGHGAGGGNGGTLDVHQRRRRRSAYSDGVRILARPLEFMRGLALVAAALLALAPSVSRLLPDAMAAPVGTEAMCTTEGLQARVPVFGEDAPALPRNHQECGYCALLASALPLPPALAMDVPIVAAGAATLLRRLAPFVARSNFPALGSRGPPAL